MAIFYLFMYRLLRSVAYKFHYWKAPSKATKAAYFEFSTQIKQPTTTTIVPLFCTHLIWVKIPDWCLKHNIYPIPYKLYIHLTVVLFQTPYYNFNKCAIQIAFETAHPLSGCEKWKITRCTNMLIKAFKS